MMNGDKELRVPKPVQEGAGSEPVAGALVASINPPQGAFVEGRGQSLDLEG